MEVEGVNFIDEVVRKMKKKEFVEKHKDAFFAGRSMADREKILENVYDRIKGSTSDVSVKGLLDE